MVAANSRLENNHDAPIIRASLRHSARWWFGVVALACLGPLLWLPYLAYPLDIDAAGYAVAAHWWARGDTLYQHITVTRPQGIFILFRALEWLGLDTAVGNHAFAAIYATLCTLALLAVATRRWGRQIGLGSAGLFAILLAAPAAQGYSTNAELFLLLPSLCGIYLLTLADTEVPGGARSIALGVGCGFCAALATLLKPSGLAMLALFGLWSLRHWWVAGASWSAWLRGLLALGGGFLLGVAPALIHGLLTVPDIYVSAVLFYRVSHDSVFAAPLVYQLGALATNLLYLFVHLPILLLALVGLWPRRVAQDDGRQALLWLWLLAAFGGAALGGNWFMHYDQPLLAPLAIATALGVRAVFRLASRRAGRYARLGLRALAPILLGLTLLIAASEMLIQARSYVATPPASVQVAKYLEAHTAPDDTVYVTYQLPAVYQLANRRPAARWLYYRELQRTPGAFAEQVALLSDPQTAPRYIVEAHPFDAFGLDQDGALRAVVARDYVLETTVDSMAIFRRAEK